jgi:hypothetical protein
MDDELRKLETAGWQALSEDGSAARRFYDEVLDEAVVMLLPGGLVITDRDAALESMSGTPWEDSSLDELRVDNPTPDTGLVTYRAEARRGSLDYVALIASLYARRPDGWRLVFHQQTPI